MPAYVEHLLLDRAEWDIALTDAIEPHTTAQAAAGIAKGWKQAEALGIQGAFDVQNPHVKQFLDTYNFNLIKGINDTTAERLREIITSAMDEGLGSDAIKSRIVDDNVLGEAGSAYRAEMIARTETARAELYGEHMSWLEANHNAAQSGVAEPFTGMVFMASPECCEICTDMDQEEFPIDDTPELPHCNCRCTIVASLNGTYTDLGGE